MRDEKLALQANERDNVATVFEEGVTAGTQVVVADAAGNRTVHTVADDIPFGHKFALRDIAQGELIIKYGEEIGVASRDIAQGTYVHVHNLDSMRGRGDLVREA
jgi:altronate dehydratase small subunit